MTQPAPDTGLPGGQRQLSARTSEVIGRNPDRRTAVVTAFDLTDRVLIVDVGGGVAERVGYLDSYEPRVGDVVALIEQRSTWLCQGRFALEGVDTGVPAGAVLAGKHFLAQANKLSFNDQNVERIVPDYTINVPLVAGRLVRLYCTFLVSSTAGNTAFPFVRIREDNLAGAFVSGHYGTSNVNNLTTPNVIEAWIRPTVTKTQTYVLTAIRLTATAATIVLASRQNGIFAGFDHGVAVNLTDI